MSEYQLTPDEKMQAANTAILLARDAIYRVIVERRSHIYTYDVAKAYNAHVLDSLVKIIQDLESGYKR